MKYLSCLRKLFILIELKSSLFFYVDKNDDYAMVFFDMQARDFDSSCLG